MVSFLETVIRVLKLLVTQTGLTVRIEIALSHLKHNRIEQNSFGISTLHMKNILGPLKDNILFYFIPFVAWKTNNETGNIDYIDSLICRRWRKFLTKNSFSDYAKPLKKFVPSLQLLNGVFYSGKICQW